jgi:hypothetical protein
VVLVKPVDVHFFCHQKKRTKEKCRLGPAFLKVVLRQGLCLPRRARGRFRRVSLGQLL